MFDKFMVWIVHVIFTWYIDSMLAVSLLHNYIFPYLQSVLAMIVSLVPVLKFISVTSSIIHILVISVWFQNTSAINWLSIRMYLPDSLCWVTYFVAEIW